MTTQLPGANPETMSNLVTASLERQFGQIASLQSMTSSSSYGLSQITMQFALNRDIDGAAQDVQAAINAAGLNNAPITQQQNWLTTGNINGTIKYLPDGRPIYGTGYLNNPNDPVPTFIGFNFGQSNQYNNPQSPSYLQGATHGNVIQSILELYNLFTTSDSAHSTYRWNDPATWPTQVVSPNPAETTPTKQSAK